MYNCIQLGHKRLALPRIGRGFSLSNSRRRSTPKCEHDVDSGITEAKLNVTSMATPTLTQPLPSFLMTRRSTHAT